MGYLPLKNMPKKYYLFWFGRSLHHRLKTPNIIGESSLPLPLSQAYLCFAIFWNTFALLHPAAPRFRT